VKSGRFFLASVVLASTLAGCQRMADVKRCRALVRSVNATLDEIEAEASKPKERIAYEQIANKYRDLGKALESFQGASPELARAVTEYAALARTASHDASALGSALDAGTPGPAGIASRDLERLSRHQKLITARIDDECRAK
jgi:hypothetical protein